MRRSSVSPRRSEDQGRRARDLPTTRRAVRAPALATSSSMRPEIVEDDQASLTSIVFGNASRFVGGLGLIALGIFGLVALAGYNPHDPSWGQATAAAVTNPGGPMAAILADLFYQVVGFAAWLPMIATIAWGIRLVFNRPLAWPWMPILALPLAVMAASSMLATIAPLPSRDVWPYRVGLGGFTGDFLFGAIGGGSRGGFAVMAALACVAFTFVAMGLRVRETRLALATTLRAFNRAAGWTGRLLRPAAGRMAGAAAGMATASYDAALEAMRARRAARQDHLDAVDNTPDAVPSFTRRQRPEFQAPEPETKPGLMGRLGGNLRAKLTSSDAGEDGKVVQLRRRSRPEPVQDEAPLAEPFEDEPPFRAPEPQRSPARDARAAAPAPEPFVPDDEVDDEDGFEPVAENPAPARRLPTPLRGVAGPADAPARMPAKAPPPPPAPVERESDQSFELPSLDLLAVPQRTANPGLTKGVLEENARQLESVLDDFGVKGEIIDVKPGPVVTLYELEPAPGTRSQRVIGLADDIARSLCALSVRVATVPGRNVIGIELPNDRRETVYLRDILEGGSFASSEARLALALGKDISGKPVIVDLARMPHLLIAGTTGSGKSVAINSMILSLVYRLTPDQCRIIMIDPKVIELSVYDDIPHLLSPVVTEPQKAVVALKWVVRQMDERYRLMSHLGVRDIFAFNRRLEQARARGEELKRRVRTGFDPATGQPIFEEQPLANDPLPLIVVVVDEVADLMLTAGKEIENAIQRLSQKARAAGIHLIVATQRPSVDVITGVIKANLPSRISFRVSSKIDSRTVLGDGGAEQLLGQGDMLYLMPGDRIVRVHGALVTDGEVEQVVRHLKAQGAPDYDDAVTSEGGAEGGGDDAGAFGGLEGAGGGDAVYNQAIQIVARDGKASTSYLQRKLSIGYNSAAKLIERMEQDGLISSADHVGRRQVLMGRGGVDGNEVTDFD